MHKLKKTRLVTAIIFFGMFIWAFLSLTKPNEYFTHTISALQFFPSLQEFMEAGFAGGGAGFILILILTLIFGRVYCSFLCPFGALQDLILRLKGQISDFKAKLKNRYIKPAYLLHYGVTVAVLVAAVVYSTMPLNILDPFANFGRMTVNLLKPFLVPFNNIISDVLNLYDINIIRPVVLHALSAAVLIYTLVILAGLISAVFLGNRIYCNTLCPVGGILSFVSRRAAYRIKIDKEKCTHCSKCETACKANCIDHKKDTVDTPRCVACFNCLGACKFDAITYEKKAKAPGQHDEARRGALKAMGLAGAGAALSLLPEKLSAKVESDLLPVKRKTLVIPPGAKNRKHFTDNCIACHLCVSACPTKVLSPGFMESGITEFLQPKFDFDKAYCNYSCTTCTRVCPTGAILPLKVEEKKITKIGEAKFVRDKCIVQTKKTPCHICNEYCPTKACSLVPFEKDLVIPKVIENLCIGCGACEAMCPARPQKAIYVEGLLIHKKADKPAAVKKKWTGSKEFPF